MNESILTWNVTNWITVIIMAVVGFVVFGFASQLIQKGTGIKPASWFGKAA